MTETTPTPKKSLGQHWLHDPTTCARIVALARPSQEENIFEIGPGAGALTRGLLEAGARVTALETDQSAISYLQETFAHEIRSGALSIIDGDGRTMELPPTNSGKWTLVSNLPYNVGSIIFLNLLGQREKLNRMVLMFQAEVAQRILAGPGTKNHGFLSVLTSLEWNAHRALKVRPGAFRPPPRVQSEVIVLEPDLEASGWCEPRETFRAFVDTCFRNRRKMLRNVLVRGGYADENIRAALEFAEVAETARAEAIAAEKFRTLFQRLHTS